VQDIDSEEKNNASEETASDSPAGGGGDEVNQEEEGEEDKQDKGEVTPPKDPLTEAETSKKRKGSPQKPSAQKKSRATKPQSQNVLTQWMISNLIITTVEDALEDILQRHEAKQETLYDRIEKELKDIQQAIQSSRVVSTVPSSTESVELGDEPTQLCILADATETRLHRVQEEKEQATEALKQEKEEALEKLRVAQQEKDDLGRSSKRTKRKSRKRKTSCLQRRLWSERQ
jgi:hypothetical protein